VMVEAQEEGQMRRIAATIAESIRAALGAKN
jgi:hypothetical protein